jgi:SAM-dependent methyltransferase
VTTLTNEISETIVSHGLTRKFWQLQQFLSSARKRGPFRTLRMAAFELWYNCRFGTNTASVIPARELDLDEEARSHARDYFPSSYLLMHEALARAGTDWRGRSFVDFGCGMGRALLYASSLPFGEIIGVELSPALAAAARRNLDRHYNAAGKSVPFWRVEIEDARRFEIPPAASVFYFFNPFDAAVLGEVADRILGSVREAPRRCIIVYVKPVHDTVFLARGFTKLAGSAADYSLFSFGVDR